MDDSITGKSCSHSLACLPPISSCEIIPVQCDPVILVTLIVLRRLRQVGKDTANPGTCSMVVASILVIDWVIAEVPILDKSQAATPCASPITG